MRAKTGGWGARSSGGIGGRGVMGEMAGAPARSGGRPKVGVGGWGRRLPVEPRVLAPGATLHTTDAGDRATLM